MIRGRVIALRDLGSEYAGDRNPHLLRRSRSPAITGLKRSRQQSADRHYFTSLSAASPVLAQRLRTEPSASNGVEEPNECNVYPRERASLRSREDQRRKHNSNQHSGEALRVHDSLPSPIVHCFFASHSCALFSQQCNVRATLLSRCSETSGISEARGVCTLRRHVGGETFGTASGPWSRSCRGSAAALRD